MKLLVCLKCNDVFNLNYEKKTCSCNESWGHYFSNGLHAQYGGPCLPLGFANGSFEHALYNQPEKDWGKEFKAFVIQKQCDTMTRIGPAPEMPKIETHEEMMKRIMSEMFSNENNFNNPLDNKVKKSETNKTKKTKRKK